MKRPGILNQWRQEVEIAKKLYEHTPEHDKTVTVGRDTFVVILNLAQCHIKELEK